MALTDWAMDPFVSPRMDAACIGCGSTTGDGRFDWMGRFTCRGCDGRALAMAEANRLAAVEAEDRERAAMWGLDA